MYLPLSSSFIEESGFAANICIVGIILTSIMFGFGESTFILCGHPSKKAIGCFAAGTAVGIACGVFDILLNVWHENDSNYTKPLYFIYCICKF